VLKAFLNSFKVPDLRNKILFTLFIIFIFRLGSHVPVPVVDIGPLQDAANQANGGFLSFINLFSGGALTRLSVFSLGIMPYITSSIIMQLLTVVIPKLQALQDQGEAGVKKLNQWTRYVTVVLALLQSTGLIFYFHSGQNGLPDVFPGCPGADCTFTVPNVLLIVLTMTAGTAMIMWLGELITQRGVGNGMSILIFTQVVAVFPSEFWNIYKTKGGFVFGIVLIVGIAIVAGVVFVEQAQRRIPVQYAKRMVGRRMYGGTSTYIPLKVNQAGVIPVIFASSLLYLPQLIVQMWHSSNPVATFINKYLVKGDHPLYMALYFLLIIFFTYFYVAITFNPTEVADNMKKYGGFIPGIRPGRPTAEYLDYVLTRITAPGALYLGLIALVPMVAFGIIGASQNFPFGGTSILIMVGVGLDTVKQIESQLQQRNYEGFLR
jgi:preprotein translocase subunit SecY